MATETRERYGLREAVTILPPADLLVVPHKNTGLVVGFPAGQFAFGPDFFIDNVRTMQGEFCNSPEFPKITFRVPTTAESLSAASYEFETRAKPQIFDLRPFQAGWIVRTSEGVFANPPRDEQGNPIIDEGTLQSYLDGTKPINVGNGQIYIVEDSERLRDFGFADYNSFERGVQDSNAFSNGGLARVLEHVEEGRTAPNLKVMSSPRFYEKINVWGFNPVSEPVLQVAEMDSGRVLDGMLRVGDISWDNDWNGHAFGVYDSGEASA